MELQRRGEDNGINDADLSIEGFSTFKSDRLVRLHLKAGGLILHTSEIGGNTPSRADEY